MRHQITPSLLGLFLVMAVVKDGGSEGASDGEEDEPIARGEFELESGESWML